MAQSQMYIKIIRDWIKMDIRNFLPIDGMMIRRVEPISEIRAYRQAAREHQLEAELADLKAHELAGTSHVSDVPIEEAIKDCKQRLEDEYEKRS